MRVWTHGHWEEATTVTHAVVRQMVLNGEIGGEMADSVLMSRLQYGEPSYSTSGGRPLTGLSVIEAAEAIHEAHIAGYIKPGFWARPNWAPAYPDRQ